MNGFLLISICFVAAVSAQTEQLDWISQLCPNGVATDQNGYVETCDYSQREYCPIASDCKIPSGWGTYGICCNRAPTPPVQHVQCPAGQLQHPDPRVTCGGSLNRPCPSPRRYNCNSQFPGGLGICCERSVSRY